MARPSKVTLEVRTARDNQAGAEAMAQIFTALPNAPTGIQRFWKKYGEQVTFEWLSQGQVTYAFVTLPENLVHHLTTQLVASYPEILVQRLAHDPLQEFRTGQPQWWAELELAAPTYLPLRTSRDFTDTDPLSTVLAALSKLKTGEAALIQLQLCKAQDGWKHAGYSAAAGKPAASAEGSSTPPHPHKEKIQEKLKQIGLSTRIHVLVQAPDTERVQQLYSSLVDTFSVFQSESNSLRATRGWWWERESRLKQILDRSVPAKDQYFSVAELATLFHLPNQQLAVIRNIAWGKSLRGEPPSNLPVYSTLSEEEREEANLFAKTEFKNEQQVFGIKKDDRRRHMYAIGKSGTGKSTLLANFIINDLKHDEGLAVVDPHGDLIETVLNYIPKHRINDVIVLDPSDPEAVVKLNLFEGGSMVHRELVASGIVSIFQKMYGHTWGPRLEYILRNSLLTLLEHNAKLGDILRILTDKRYRDHIVEDTQDPVLKNFWNAEYNTLNEKQRTEAISPILNKVGQFVTSPMIRQVVDTKSSSFDIEQIMNDGKILLVNLSQGKLGEDNAALLGAMIITKIQLAAMNRVYIDEDKRRDFYLYIDEFQNFATTSFVKILSEARKYRLNLILANQYIDQIPEEVRSAIFGNAGNIVSFIVGASDADYLTKEFGGKYTAEDLVSLSRYQIIVRLLIDGHMSSPFPATTLGLANSTNQNKETVLRVSRERYARRRGEAEEMEKEEERKREEAWRERDFERKERNKQMGLNNPQNAQRDDFDDDGDGEQRDRRPPRPPQNRDNRDNRNNTDRDRNDRRPNSQDRRTDDRPRRQDDRRNENQGNREERPPRPAQRPQEPRVARVELEHVPTLEAADVPAEEAVVRAPRNDEQRRPDSQGNGPRRNNNNRRWDNRNQNRRPNQNQNRDDRPPRQDRQDRADNDDSQNSR